MGEKGNDVQSLAGSAATAALAQGSATTVQTITTTASETVVGLGQDLVGTIKNKSIGAVADTTILAARERLRRRPDDPEAPDDNAQHPAIPDDAEQPAAEAPPSGDQRLGQDAERHPAD